MFIQSGKIVGKEIVKNKAFLRMEAILAVAGEGKRVRKTFQVLGHAKDIRMRGRFRILGYTWGSKVVQTAKYFPI